MSQASEKAEVFFIIVKRLFKWLLYLIIAFVLFLVVVFTYEDYESKKRKELDDQVEVNAYIPTDGSCNNEFPYAYSVVNKSNKVVESVSFSVKITPKGFSEELNSYTSLTEDKILSPNEGWSRCFRATTKYNFTEIVNRKDVDFTIGFKSVRFRE